jgi:hypothetical protein
MTTTTTAPGAAAAHRFAVYFAPPPGHALWRAGCDWLGRDPTDPAPSAAAPPHRGAPWRYSFHATLKAPLRLRPGAGEVDFLQALQSVAEGWRPFPMPPLQVAWLDRFIALRPEAALAAGHPLRRLADACQLTLDDWRAAPTPTEAGRHASPTLTLRQRDHAQRLGYPHVLDDWRFHMTLSDSFALPDGPDAQALFEQARRHFAAALREPLHCDAVCLFTEPAPGAPFVLARRVGFNTG